MLILGIETSCDETAAAVVKDGTLVLSNTIASSSAAFKESGGVIPEEAARKQVECIVPVINQALKEANTTWEAIDAIAVTYGPGLLGSLLVGVTAARTLASLHNKPIIPVHHTLGHLSSTWLIPNGENPNNSPVFPILTLSASGGHTDLWYRTNHTKGRLVGRTLDDAAGEAFDKGAALLGLSYPGGPAIAKAALSGNCDKYKLPSPLKGKPGCNFSFSGLKTALKYLLREININSKKTLADVAASYQHSICRHLVSRILLALEQEKDINEIHLVGGVSANSHLRALISQIEKVVFRTPLNIIYCTDNAAMIASAGFFLYSNNKNLGTEFISNASMPLESVMS